MNKIEGKKLSSVWSVLSDEQKTNYLKQIQEVLETLRTIKSEYIGSINGTECLEEIFDGNHRRFVKYLFQEIRDRISSHCHEMYAK